MGKAYTPEVASGNTSSPVRTNLMGLQGAKALTTFSSGGTSGTPHNAQGVGAFKAPSQGAHFSAPKAAVTHEKRSSEVPHVNMHPTGGF